MQIGLDELEYLYYNLDILKIQLEQAKIIVGGAPMDKTIEKIAQLCAEMKREDQVKVLWLMEGMKMATTAEAKSA